MNSFNVYEQTTKEVGGNTPVWLGTVKPIPRGATCEVTGKIPAGCPVIYNESEGTFMAIENSAEIENVNGYLYNDIYSEDVNSATPATGAIVKVHAEGLLIDRVHLAVSGEPLTDSEIEQLQAKIPGVLLVRG